LTPESKVFLLRLFRTLKPKNKNKNQTLDPGVKPRDDDDRLDRDDDRLDRDEDRLDRDEDRLDRDEDRLRVEMQYMALDGGIGDCDTVSSGEKIPVISVR